MLATVPEIVARQIISVRPHLKTKPFKIRGSFWDLLWPVSTNDDEPCWFARDKITRIAKSLG